MHPLAALPAAQGPWCARLIALRTCVISGRPISRDRGIRRILRAADPANPKDFLRTYAQKAQKAQVCLQSMAALNKMPGTHSKFGEAEFKCVAHNLCAIACDKVLWCTISLLIWCLILQHCVLLMSGYSAAIMRLIGA